MTENSIISGYFRCFG